MTHLANPKRVLVIGEIFKDEFVYGKVSRISPEAPVPILDLENDLGLTFLGGAGNAAANLKSLAPDLDVHLCGILSKKDKDLVYTAGLNDTYMYLEENPFSTITKTRYIDQDSSYQFLRVDANKYTAQQIHNFEEYILSVISPSFFEVILISDYNKGLITENIARWLCQNNFKVIVDTKKQFLDCFRGAICMKLNENEFKRCFEELRQSMSQFPYILKTQGKAGMSYYEFGRLADFNPSIKNNPNLVRDLTGAGDVVAAVLAKDMAAANEITFKDKTWWKQVMWEANVAAGISVLKSGTCVVEAEELSKELQNPQAYNCRNNNSR